MYNNYYQPKYMGMPNANQTMTPTYQPMQMPIQVPIQQTTTGGLLGKSVDSIDVVKAMDIPLDGSISYFPLTDGSAIVSKQLQADGTSKTTIYKPVSEEQNEISKYITFEDLKKEINKIDLSDIDDLKEDIKEIKKQLKEMRKKGE